MSVRTLASTQRVMFTRQYAPIERMYLVTSRRHSFGRLYGVANRIDSSPNDIGYVLRIAFFNTCSLKVSRGEARKPVSDFRIGIEDLLTNARRLGLRTMMGITLSNPKPELVEAFVIANASMIKTGHFLRMCPESKMYYLSLAPGARELLIHEWNENIHGRDEWYFQNAQDDIWNNAPMPQEYGNWADAPVPDDYGILDDRSTVCGDEDDVTDDHSWYSDDGDDEELFDEDPSNN